MTKYTKARIEELLAEIRQHEIELEKYADLSPDNPRFEQYCTAQTTLTIAKAKFTALKGESND